MGLNYYFLLLILRISNACLVQPKKHFGIPGVWADKNITRNERLNCDCGIDIALLENGLPPWNLFVHTNNSVCTGTIVTSNLVVTSHKCIQSEEMNIFDFWPVKTRRKVHIVREDEVLVSTNKTKGEGITFNVTKIIYNMDYIVKRKQKGYLNSDILLLVVKADFSSEDSDYRPICVPKMTKIKDIYGETVTVYSYNITDDIFSSNAGYYYDGQERNISDQKLKDICVERDSLKFKQFVVNKGWIGQKHCPVHYFKGKKTGNHSRLCIMSGPTVNVNGVPLIINGDGRGTAMLVGIKDDSKYVPGFTNVLYMSKYIEHKAQRYGSRWCKEPKADVARINSKLFNIPAKFYPWPCRNESLDCECGVENNKGGRIAGGEKAGEFQYGWIVHLNCFILYNETTALTTACGGTIINDKMILTAAHCVDRDQIRKDPSICKATIIKTNDGEGLKHSTIIVNAEQIIIHPDYAQNVQSEETYVFQYDIALIILRERLQFNAVGKGARRPICLWNKTDEMKIIGINATTLGWGLTNPNDPNSHSPYLKKLEVPILERLQCKYDEEVKKLVTELFICASKLTRWQSVDRGDSGGPLLIQEGKKWLQVGITSWVGEKGVCHGNNCRYPGPKVSMFTDLRHPEQLAFVDFHAEKVGAKWCKRR